MLWDNCQSLSVVLASFLFVCLLRIVCIRTDEHGDMGRGKIKHKGDDSAKIFYIWRTTMALLFLKHSGVNVCYLLRKKQYNINDKLLPLASQPKKKGKKKHGIF